MPQGHKSALRGNSKAESEETSEAGLRCSVNLEGSGDLEDLMRNIGAGSGSVAVVCGGVCGQMVHILAAAANPPGEA